LASYEEVKEFLRRFKARMATTGLEFAERDKNIAQLAYYGWFKHDLEKIIQELTEEQYSQGPMPDEGGVGGQVWVFGVEIESNMIYLKLRLGIEAVCISFHPPEYEMDFPLRRHTRENSDE
jgi:hypothetical protein